MKPIGVDNVITLTIDKKKMTASEGETILQCALRNDIQIPHLCTHPSLPPFGACRLCLVEVEGMRGFPPSCSTPVAEGMVVTTNNAKLQELRRNILGLMMLEHPSACLVCGKRELCEEFRPAAEKASRTTGCHTCNNKDVCDVRVLSEELGFADLPVPPVYHERPLERNNPFIDRDMNLCILCGRCVRICQLHQGSAVIDFISRGSKTRIGQAFDRNLLEAGCTFCGSCVDVCPTGSIADRYAKWRAKTESAAQTTCVFCPAACALKIEQDHDKVRQAKAVDPSKPLCALGRFGAPELLNGYDRLQVPLIRVGENLREVSWEQALAATGERLANYKSNDFAFVCDQSSTLEDRYIFEKFTRSVMNSDHYIEIKPSATGESKTKLPTGIKCAWLTGDFLGGDIPDSVELLIIQDIYSSPVSEKADAVLPVALYAEIDGTILDEQGIHRPLNKVCKPAGQSQPDWQIVEQIAQQLNASELNHTSAAAIAQEMNLKSAELYIERDSTPQPALDLAAISTHYRGHQLGERIPGLRRVIPAQPVAKEEECASQKAELQSPTGGCAIIEKREVAPNVHEFVIEAPHVAKKAQPGQFIIVMVDDKSERVPYTLSDWDIEKGTITIVVLEAGQSSRKIALLEAGDHLAHVTGPLGVPLEIKNYGKVVLSAGCYGIGAIVALARALKQAGNEVVSVVEARSHYMHYFADRIKDASTELIQTTIDGSMNIKGHSIDVIAKMLKEGQTIDRIIAIGCPFMMMLAARETKPYKVKTLVSLNPIMVDGTGMCGACRVTVGEETKFACVDGPFFDAHLIDWDELWDRRAAYHSEEISVMARSEPVTKKQLQHSGSTCGICAH